MESNLTVWVLGFVHPIALIMALVFMVSYARRRGESILAGDYLSGTLFAIALVYSMSDPISLGEAGIFDMRFLLIGAATALVCPKAGLIPLGVGVSYRMIIGGAGVLPGVVGMFIAFGAAAIWRSYVGHWKLGEVGRTLSLGLLISFHALTIFLAPQEFWYTLFVNLAPIMVLVNLTGIAIVKFLLDSEMNLISEAEGHRRDAQQDHLTGLMNRRSFEQKFEAVPLTQSGDDGLSTIYFDIDNFKQINDRHGHLFGDHVLQSIGQRLKGIIRPDDLFSRLGGDEFVIVLKGVGQSEARQIAERCCERISREMVTADGVSVPVTISIGAIWNRTKPALEQLLEQADAALYEAKKNGRNTVVFKSPTQCPLGLPTGAPGCSVDCAEGGTIEPNNCPKMTSLLN